MRVRWYLSPKQVNRIVHIGGSIYLEDGDTSVRIIQAFDAMSDAHDQFALCVHGVDEFHRMLTGIGGLAELAGRSV